MKKESKIMTAARAAKADGYEYMTSVVKSKFNTTYYHVNKIDDILSVGEWIPAPFNSYGWHGRIGTSTPPKNSINKSNAIYKYCK